MDKNFRLPEDVRPERYFARLRPNVPDRTFQGDLTIEIVVAKPRNQIVLHAVDLQIIRAALRQEGEDRLEASACSHDAASQTVTLTFAREIAAGGATLEIHYAGRIQPALRGLYLGGDILCTQFEAADARRAFPCFDEPAFKARWSLAVELPASDTTSVAISNGTVVSDGIDPDLGRRIIEFTETRLLSTYLIALIVGRLESSPPVTVRDVPIRTWAVPGKVHLSAFGQECAAAALPRLEDYFGVSYPFGKLDQIGIPDFEAGAMENAGAITFREVALLTDPKQSSIPVQKRVAEVVTHELAHQWFGNLVTMVWWDDLWLNEAFATWMAYKVVDQWRPEWRMWVDFEGGKAAGLALDALRSTHPIRADVKNVDEASENFDAITYEKGGAVLRMFEGWLGADKFRDGLRRYIKRHENGNARAADLWKALAEASGLPVDEVARSWLETPGFPLLEVGVEGNQVKIAQRRFFAEPAQLTKGSTESWLVPLVLRYADAQGVHEHRTLLREKETTLAPPAQGDIRWLVANAHGSGFYRVRYDRAAVAGLARSLPALDVIERLNLLSDNWALVRAGAVGIDAVFDLLVAFAGDRDYAVLDEVVGRLAAIEHRLLPDADRATFQALVARLFERQLAEIGWDARSGEKDDDRLRRAAVIRALASIGRMPAVIDEAVQRLMRHLAATVDGKSGQGLDPNLLDTAVYVAARSGDETRFEKLRAQVPREADPAARRRFLLALASFEDPALARRAVDLALTSEVTLQDLPSFMARLFENRGARPAAWGLVRDRWSDVARRADSPGLQRRILEGLSLLPEQGYVAEVEQFFATHPLPQLKQTVAQTLERLRLDAELRQRVMLQVTNWLNRQSTVHGR